MKGKTFLILLVAAGLLVALSLLRLRDGKQSAEVMMGALLFADLPVNEVASVTIADADNTVTLVKGESIWQVKERDGYAANFAELRDMIVKLSRLKIGRSFTGSPESLARLSLNPPSASTDGDSGKQITLTNEAGDIIADIILGQLRKTDSGNGGQYLRRTDKETVLLVDGNLQFLKAAPAEWVEKEILNIKADDVASVTCFTGDASSPAYTLTRHKEGEPATLTPKPQGRVADAAKIEQVFEALAPLTVDDVKKADSQQPAAESERTRLVYRLYDGRRITLFPESAADGDYTLRLLVAQEPMSHTKVDDADGPASGPDTSEDGETAKPDASEDTTVITAQQLNEKLKPWLFSIKQWQFDSFIVEPDALLETVEKENETNS